ncbi:hypothetical protein GCM10009037_22050 [Halarchaeum grantii]|uniref:Uncharacterized protein n=1 Tax=Halarchaeum grantii TaxID=1193105 RepID=A0A830EWN0_9EURY|nr:hypothetical protein [Halarchaeum grantii]GGL38068.1 hypothetical protein GCM10009037_22050 [Halarchaeum grantii]
MPSALRDGRRVALNRPRVFAFAGGALLAECALRLALAVAHPVLAVVCPPVVAVPVLGAVAPTVRAAVVDADATPDWRVPDRLRERGPRLLALAVGCHAVALALGAAAFLVLDTPVRYAVYAAGGSVSKTVVHVAPLVGIATGAFVAWGALAPAIGRAAAGAPLRASVRAPLCALADRRRSAAALGLQAACALVALCVAAAVLLLADARYPTRDAALLALLTLVFVVAGTLVLLATLTYPMHVALAVGSERVGAVPVRRVALAALVVSGLVVGAGAIRVSETRPGVGSADATLPANATDAYAVARERTVTGSYRTVATEIRDGERVVATAAVERDDRRVYVALRYDDRTRSGYADSCVTYRLAGFDPALFALGERRVDGGVAVALPGYWQLTDGDAVTGPAGYGLPEADTGAWTTVREANGTRTLELRGGPAVFDALQRGEASSVNASTARVRVRVDEARGVVLGGRARLNATLGDGETRLVRNLTYAVETGDGVAVDRPDALGSRSLGAWTWDVFAY